jgi:hypothetical protein
MKTQYHFNSKAIASLNIHFGLAGYVVRMEQIRMYIAFLLESQKERDHYKDQDVGGWIILKWFLQRYNAVV